MRGTRSDPTGDARRSILVAAGIATILLGLGAALLPVARGLPGSALVGWLLLMGGVIELGAAAARREARSPAAVAAAATCIAGILFVLNPFAPLLPVAYVVTAWLLTRGAILLLVRAQSSGVRRLWAGFNAAADLLLGTILLIGLPIAAFTMTMFGPTSEVVASFGIVLAASFLVTGMALIGSSAGPEADAEEAMFEEQG